MLELSTVIIIRPMPAFRPSPRLKDMVAWQLTMCLTIIALLARAVIPAGYMPVMASGQGALFSMTLCHMGAGITVRQATLPDHAGHAPSNDDASNKACPVGLVVSQALLPDHGSPMLTAVTSHHPALLSPDNQALPPLPALGPPLGSRAPPPDLG